MLTGCAGSSNSTACKLYEDDFNKLADTVKLVNDGALTTDDARAQSDLIPSRMADAYDKATGDVAVEMRSSLELATARASNPSDEDTGVAWLMSTDEV
ncbi:hypothetical protein ACC691_37415, partial [Rhizobium johnstonii]|uniref:hypothetical protein n=1 Tax=Rhizobium johnstonii TaxID=3019933 RepID=UPI003F96953D